jgi:hypothetical protein
MALRAAKANEDDARPLRGQRFGAAAELPLGPELYVIAGSAGDLVAGDPANCVFNGVRMALRATEMHEDAVAPVILSPVFLSNPNRVFDRATSSIFQQHATQTRLGPQRLSQAPRTECSTRCARRTEMRACSMRENRGKSST